MHSIHSHSLSSYLCRRLSPQGPLWSGLVTHTFLNTWHIKQLTTGHMGHLLGSFLLSASCSLQGSACWIHSRAWYFPLHLCSHMTLLSTWISCLVSWGSVWPSPPPRKDNDSSIVHLQKLTWCLTYNCAYAYLFSHFLVIKLVTSKYPCSPGSRISQAPLHLGGAI